MRLNLNAPVIALATGEVLALDDAAGTRVKARCGSVWITEEGEREDFVITAGQSRTLKRDGRTLIQAMQPTWIALHEPLPEPYAVN